MAKVSQEEYDRVIRTIEENSCFRFSAGTTDSGAFLIPVINDVPQDVPFYRSWDELKELAQILSSKPKERG